MTAIEQNTHLTDEIDAEASCAARAGHRSWAGLLRGRPSEGAPFRRKQGSRRPSLTLSLRTTCDSPPRLPTRSRIRREASTGRLNGAGCTGIWASRVAPVGPWSFAWSLIEQISHHLRAPQGRSHVSDDPRTPRLPPSSGVLGDAQNRALGGRDPKTVAEPLPRRSGLSRGE